MSTYRYGSVLWPYLPRYLARTWRAVALIGALPMDSNCPMMHGDGSRFFVCVVAFKCAYVRRTAAGMIVGLFFFGGGGGFRRVLCSVMVGVNRKRNGFLSIFTQAPGRPPPPLLLMRRAYQESVPSQPVSQYRGISVCMSLPFMKIPLSANIWISEQKNPACRMSHVACRLSHVG